jgi:thymidine phosphorylase
MLFAASETATLRRDEIEHFVTGVTNRTIPDYQAAALLMAIVLRGMTADETAQLTDAMVRSGVGSTSTASTAFPSTSTAPAGSATRPR